MRTVQTLVGGWLTTFVLCAVVWAQAKAQISGNVKDQSGAVLPAVEITATQTETGITRKVVSDEAGSFVLPDMPLGPYRLEAALSGFRTFVQTGLVLQVNSNPVVNAVLAVGQVTETVEVQANAAMVETRSVGVGNVIENERILELPLNGRRATDLITLAGAAVETPGVNITRNMQNMPAISVGGGLTSGLAYMLDGAMHNDPTDSLSLPFPFPDALQEFKVQASALSADNGMHSAGSVSAVTKAGTNQFHGDLFEFVRNGKFNARNFFALRRDTLKRNQFGGTVGGPIKKNKMFFFGGYQGTTTRQDPADQIAFVPTASMLAGDWTAVTSPVCNGGRQITLLAPFVNNRINPASYSAAAMNIAEKLPKTDNPCGRTIYGFRYSLNEAQAVGRIDYQASARQTIFGRYLATTFDNPAPYDIDPAKNLLNTAAPSYDNLAQSFTVGSTYLVSANTINSLRLAANRTGIHRAGASFFNAPSVGVNIYSYLPKTMIMTVAGGFNLGCGFCQDLISRTASFQLTDDLNLIRGKHQLSFGGNVANWRMNFIANQASLGSFAFTSQATGLGMADFLTGQLFSLTQIAPNPMRPGGYYAGIYAQDIWKVKPNVTLTGGVRWEPNLAITYRNGQVYNFDYPRFQQGIKSTVFRNAPAGLYYPGDPGFPGNAATYNQLRNFAPRVGLAWDVKGDGRTSIRASYGITYELLRLEQFLVTFDQVPPYIKSNVLTSPAGGFDNPWQGFPGGNPFPYGPPTADVPFLPFTAYDAIPYNLKTPRSELWNLSVQRQLLPNWLLSVTYLGTLQTHLLRGAPANLATYIPGASTTANTNQRRQFYLERPTDGQYIGAMNQYSSDATGTYHGLLISIERRASNGVTVAGNYTWSHCINDANSMDLQPFPGGGDAISSSDRRKDRGNCSADRRQILNITSVAEMPAFGNRAMRALASGWRLSGIYRFSTGQFVSPFAGQDRALSGVATGSQRLVQVLANPYGNGSVSNYLNPAAFAQPALGTVGNLGRNNILGPSTSRLDIALSRVFRLREAQRLELRAEAFNATNSLIKMSPNLNFSATNTFGQITAAADPRIMQFALKYLF